MASLLHRQHLEPSRWYSNKKAEPLNGSIIESDLQQLQQAANGSIAVQSWPQVQQSTGRADTSSWQNARARQDLPAPRPGWHFHSFSSLSRHSHSGPAEFGAADEQTAADIELFDGGQDLPELPGGPLFGDAIHQVLEQLNDAQWRHNQQNKDEIQQLCQSALLHMGVALDSNDAKAEQQLHDTTQLVLNCLQSPVDGLGSLQSLASTSRKAEMEFHFKLAGSDRDALLALMQQHGYAQELRFQPGEQALRGLMHGYIDLVAEHDQRFFVIDYKTNWLGNSRQLYQSEHMQQAIRHHHYDVQYLIYLTALHRYLQQRLPNYDIDRHLGGARYLFLRGMSPQHAGCGVFSDRPSSELIVELDRVFAGGLSA